MLHSIRSQCSQWQDDPSHSVDAKTTHLIFEQNQLNIFVGNTYHPITKQSIALRITFFYYNFQGFQVDTFAKTKYPKALSLRCGEIQKPRLKNLQITLHVWWSISKGNKKLQLKIFRTRENFEDPSEIANCKPENHKSSNDKLLESWTKVLTTYRETLESQWLNKKSTCPVSNL